MSSFRKIYVARVVCGLLREGDLLRNDLISFHIGREFSTVWLHNARKSFRRTQFSWRPSLDEMEYLIQTLRSPLQLPLPIFLPTKPSITHTLPLHLQWTPRSSSEKLISTAGRSFDCTPVAPLISVTFVRDDTFTRLMSPANSKSWSPPIPPLNLSPWNLPDLTAAAVRKNDHQRESRIKDLELELTAWKQAHANLLESVERERKAHNVQIASFNRHFASLDFFKVRAFVSPRNRSPPELNGISRTKAPLSFASLMATRTSFQGPCLYKDRWEAVRLPSRSPRPLRDTLPAKTFKSSAGSRSGSPFTTIRGAFLNCCSTTIYVRPSSSKLSFLGSVRRLQDLQWSTLVSTRVLLSPRS